MTNAHQWRILYKNPELFSQAIEMKSNILNEAMQVSTLDGHREAVNLPIFLMSLTLGFFVFFSDRFVPLKPLIDNSYANIQPDENDGERFSWTNRDDVVPSVQEKDVSNL